MRFEAMALVRKPVPAAMIMDVSLPAGGGLVLMGRLARLEPPPRILVSSMQDEYLFARRALAAGRRTSTGASCLAVTDIGASAGDSQEPKIITLFHFALTEHGQPFPGTSHSIGQQSLLFETVSKTLRLLRRIASARRDLREFPISP